LMTCLVLAVEGKARRRTSTFERKSAREAGSRDEYHASGRLQHVCQRTNFTA
jgi:hypothetical protein